jgi:hypothetical protein
MMVYASTYGATNISSRAVRSALAVLFADISFPHKNALDWIQVIWTVILATGTPIPEKPKKVFSLKPESVLKLNQNK